MGVMPKIDVTNETIIDSPPLDVYRAILSEFTGVTHWWMPWNENKLRGDIPANWEGAIIDITSNPTSRLKVKFSAKVTKIVEAESIEEEYAGDFLGTGKWTFEPTDGKTKLKFRFNVRTNRLLFSLISPFVDIGKQTSDCTQKGFKGLATYLSMRAEMNKTKK